MYNENRRAELVTAADAIYDQVFGYMDKYFTPRKTREIFEWLYYGDLDAVLNIDDLAAEWREYSREPEEVDTAVVLAAHMIRPWRAPQWLVEPIGTPSDQDDLDAIWLAGYSVLSREVRGWGEYNALIDVNGTHYLARLS